MIQRERELRILELFRDNNVIRVGHLTAELNVTAATIRNDLIRMTKKGLVRRVHGGAVLEKSYTAYESPFFTPRRLYERETADWQGR